MVFEFCGVRCIEVAECGLPEANLSVCLPTARQLYLINNHDEFAHFSVHFKKIFENFV